MSLDPWHVLTANYGHIAYPGTAFVTLLDCFLYLILTYNVGRARMKFGVPATETGGPQDLMRIIRAHLNTLEQLAFHLPVLWVAALAVSDNFATLGGAVWLFARTLYAARYYQKANRRTKGFLISMIANMVLLIGAFCGVIASF
ncbi:MAG: MAPEG family protein [Alphaproteobacteria bacterium]|nr:MAPEG family protein [Alphaproteobacteria bacterium]MBV8549576.1 MAPEG family protein [Alphaproteobacteria bacterium]